MDTKLVDCIKELTVGDLLWVTFGLVIMLIVVAGIGRFLRARE